MHGAWHTPVQVSGMRAPSIASSSGSSGPLGADFLVCVWGGLCLEKDIHRESRERDKHCEEKGRPGGAGGGKTRHSLELGSGLSR